MFTLVTEKRKFFRVKRGQTRQELELALNLPIQGDAFCGRILQTEEEYGVYVAGVGDSYRTIAEKCGISESELKKINGGRTVYPTRRLFIPRV